MINLLIRTGLGIQALKQRLNSLPQLIQLALIGRSDIIIQTNLADGPLLPQESIDKDVLHLVRIRHHDEHSVRLNDAVLVALDGFDDHRPLDTLSLFWQQRGEPSSFFVQDEFEQAVPAGGVADGEAVEDYRCREGVAHVVLV